MVPASPTSSRSRGPRRRSRCCAPLPKQGWPQRARPDHHAAPGRWPQAAVPADRLQAGGQGRRAGEGRAHRVRPQPHRADRAAALRRRREALHHRAEGHQAGRPRSSPGRARTSSRATTCRCATSRSAPRSTRGAAPGRRRQAGPFGRRRHPAAGSRGRVRHAAYAVGRDPAGGRALPAPPSARSATPTSRTSTGARPAGCVGRASARPCVVSR